MKCLTITRILNDVAQHIHRLLLFVPLGFNKDSPATSQPSSGLSLLRHFALWLRPSLRTSFLSSYFIRTYGLTVLDENQIRTAFNTCIYKIDHLSFDWNSFSIKIHIPEFPPFNSYHHCCNLPYQPIQPIPPIPPSFRFHLPIWVWLPKLKARAH
jgi:hypothetical protein